MIQHNPSQGPLEHMDPLAKGALFVGALLVLGKIFYPQAGIWWLLPVPQDQEREGGQH
jgi:hypothetical protein